MRKPKRQPSLRGGRFHGSTGFEPRVWAAIQREARRFNVSIPFVLSVMAADSLGIDLDDNARYASYRRPAMKLVKAG